MSAVASQVDAKAWLIDALGTSERRASEVTAEATAAGITPKRLRRAREAVCADPVQRDGAWHWQLRPDQVPAHGMDPGDSKDTPPLMPVSSLAVPPGDDQTPSASGADAMTLPHAKTVPARVDQVPGVESLEARRLGVPRAQGAMIEPQAMTEADPVDQVPVRRPPQWMVDAAMAADASEVRQVGSGPVFARAGWVPAGTGLDWLDALREVHNAAVGGWIHACRARAALTAELDAEQQRYQVALERAVVAGRMAPDFTGRHPDVRAAQIAMYDRGVTNAVRELARVVVEVRDTVQARRGELGPWLSVAYASGLVGEERAAVRRVSEQVHQYLAVLTSMAVMDVGREITEWRGPRHLTTGEWA